MQEIYFSRYKTSRAILHQISACNEAKSISLSELLAVIVFFKNDRNKEVKIRNLAFLFLIYFGKKLARDRQYTVYMGQGHQDMINNDILLYETCPTLKIILGNREGTTFLLFMTKKGKKQY